MNILVIGGAGFLGCNLVRYCLSQGNAHLTVLDSLDPRLQGTDTHLRAVWEQIRFVHGDMRDEAILAELIPSPELIFNCAAQTSHPLSIREPFLDADINCLGNLKLLEAVRRLNPKAVLIYPSSSTVAGKTEGETVAEDHPERPLEIYSANKGVAEKYYRIYHSLHGLNTVVLRFANLYGPFGKGHPDFGFINYFIHQARTNQKITIFGSGEQTRNVLYVEDACAVLWRAAHDKRLFGETLLATGAEHLSVRAIAETIVKVFEGGTIREVDWPKDRKNIEIGSVRFSAARLRGLTGWEPCYNFSSGLERTKAVLAREATSP